jgi:hypothetical protein
LNVVFLGPTLSTEIARRICDAVFLPPAKRGDIAAAVERFRPRTIALIDGYFEQVPAVWHKEILFALAQGIAVAGAASMGALRAAELRAFGMHGVGRIFEAYAAGRFAPFTDPFEDDDEVAVVHAPIELGYAASDAMVDIRATLAAAADSNVIGADDAQAIAGIAKALFYKDRRYAAVLEAAAAGGIEAKTLAALGAWLTRGRVAQKQLDAEALLRRLAQGGLAASPPAFRFERTLLWEKALLSERAPFASGDEDSA